MVHDFDSGLLSPVTAGKDGAVSDFALLRALIDAERGLVRAWKRLGVAPADAATEIDEALSADPATDDVTVLADAAIAGGNPVIPLVASLRARVSDAASAWVHRGATSQDILDTALMCIASEARAEVLVHLDAVAASLRVLAKDHRDTVTVSRTLTQHAVPTTFGARAATWLHGVERAGARLAALELPAQLGGAGGTLASFAEIGGVDVASQLPAAFASEVGLAAPAVPWHTTRWPVTELGDALVQTIDAVAKIAADVATLSRTEIGEVTERAGGGSSAMPQKRNPVASILVRSAGIRAPHLSATLHSAAALAVDERPDGAWHAEWPALRELLRLALGATATAARLGAGLQLDTDAVARNLGLSGGLVLAERLSLILGPLIGADGVKMLISAAAGGEDLAGLVRALPETAGIDVDALLDPARYTGLAGRLADTASEEEHR